MSARRKLLVVAGAGSSLDLGMPSVWEVGHLLRENTQEDFCLADNASVNLYDFLYDKIASYWNEEPILRANKKEPNFEDILYVISTLLATYRAGKYSSAIGACLNVVALPDITQFGKRLRVDASVWHHLGQHLVDSILTNFRERCDNPAPEKATDYADFNGFIHQLNAEFELAAVTLNYDNLIYKALPSFETGFDVQGDGHFSSRRILGRTAWPCLLHLHGSVHFDMRTISTDLHRIFWEPDLGNCHQNSFGREPRLSTEGNQYPTSSIVAGYGKTFQILKSPFRTYYSELERLIHESDATLFLGYGFGDIHLNASFAGYFANRDRPVVVIDWASDDTFTAGASFYEGSRAAKSAMDLFNVAPHRLSWLGYTFPDTVAQLRQAKEFERCREPGFRLSLWYNGMLEACRNYDKVIAELNHG